MKIEEFEKTIIPRVVEAWPGFGRRWNPFNQKVIFKLLSPFRVDQVDIAIDNHRFDCPDSRSPEFKTIVAKLWNLKRGGGGPSANVEVDLRGATFAWAKNRSDEDLNHFRYLAAGWYSNRIPTLWPIVDASPVRCPISLIACWSMDRDSPLGFDKGSDEWQELYLEYDMMERQRENDRLGKWSPQNRSVAVKVSAHLANVALPPVASTALDGEVAKFDDSRLG